MTESLRFNLPYLHRIQELAAEKVPLVDNAIKMKLQNVLRDQPMYSSPDFKRLIMVMLRRRQIGEIVDFRF